MKSFVMLAVAAAAAGCLTVTAPSARASLIVSESFNYNLNDGDLLNTGSPTEGIGFSDTWQTSTGDFAGTYSSTGYTNPALAGASGGSGFFVNDLGAGYGVHYRPFNDPLVAGSGYTSWFTAIVDPTSSTYTGARVMFEATTSSGKGYGINFDRKAGTPDHTDIYAFNQGADAGSSYSFDGYDPFLMVGKFVDDGATGGTVTVWINPTDLSSEAQLDATAAGIVTSTKTLTERTGGVAFRGGGSHAHEFADELRLGNTLADVAAAPVVPEPASMALLAAGGLALLTRRSRRL